jgi:hypothetical protein
VVEAVFFRKVGVFVGADVLFQWRGTLSVGLNRARGARGFEGDPAEANPSVGGHEHQRVRSSAPSALLAGGRGTGGVADDKGPLEALTGVLVFPADGGGTHRAGHPGFDQTSS